jgi:hypothetical protein
MGMVGPGFGVSKQMQAPDNNKKPSFLQKLKSKFSGIKGVLSSVTKRLPSLGGLFKSSSVVTPEPKLTPQDALRMAELPKAASLMGLSEGEVSDVIVTAEMEKPTNERTLPKSIVTNSFLRSESLLDCAKSNYCDENISFLRDADALVSDPKIDIQAFFDKYISADAPEQVNISSTMRIAIADDLGSGDREGFVENLKTAMSEIEDMMKKNVGQWFKLK